MQKRRTADSRDTQQRAGIRNSAPYLLTIDDGFTIISSFLWNFIVGNSLLLKGNAIAQEEYC